METLQQLNTENCSSPKARRIKQKYDVLQPCFSSGTDSNPIIFLHGTRDTRKTWRLVANIIVNKTGRKAYLIDARNHGESYRPKESDFDALTQDVVDFMDDNGIRRAVVVGHSMGGRTAINFALKHPDRTEALVVENISPKNVEKGSNALFRILIDSLMENIERIPTGTDLSTVKRIMLNFLFMFGKKVNLHSDGIPEHIVLFRILYNSLMENMRSIHANTDLSTLKRNVLSISKKEITNGSERFQLIDLDSIALVKIDGKILPEYDQDVESNMEKNFLVPKNVPFEGRALFLYGDSNSFNLEEDYSMKKLFPKATTQTITNAMHLIHLQHPEEFAEAVSHFILLKDTYMSKI